MRGRDVSFWHVVAAGLLAGWFAVLPSARADVLEWARLADIPDEEGFAAPFAGVSNGALIVAGGANFPGPKPWEGGTKVWYDSAFVLERPDGAWRRAGKLPRPLAYGISISTPEGVACLGGGDAARHYADCFLLRYKGGAVETTPLPPLPRPCAFACGAMVGTTIYVAGGIERPDDTAAMGAFWSLDSTNPEARWIELDTWPGAPRMLATAGALDGSFFLFSGTALDRGSDGKPVRRMLRDAYRFKPGSGWRRLADMPRVAVAAPTPAPALGAAHLLVLGGEDGKQAHLPQQEHRGFPRAVLAYHTITDTWTKMGEVPFSLVTTPVVRWQERIVIPGGEARPGIRSTEVWSAAVASAKARFGWINYGTLAAYLLGMVAIGWVCAGRNKNTDDYFKAGGRIPWWAAGISIYATMLSSITFMAIPAKAFATDWTYFWANVPILLLAPAIIAFYLPFFRRLDVTSAYEYLEKRFNLAARLYASAAFILFQIGRQSIVLLLPSLALAMVSDLDVRASIVLVGTLCVVYTMLGGVEAVVWTDVAQSVVLLGAALAALVIIVVQYDGGPAAAWTVAVEHGKFHMFNFTLDPRTAANAFWVILVGNLFIVLVPYTSDQAVVQRYLTTKDQASAARAIWTNALLSIPSGVLFFAIGTALWVFYRQAPDKLDPTLATDAIFPAFIVNQLPLGVAGLVIAGIFAAAQSTVSGSLNSVVTALMTDFYRRFGGKAEAAAGLRLARLLTAAIGLVATLTALALVEFNLQSLWDTYNSLVGLAGSGLAGLFALGIFSRRATGSGAIAGAAVSCLVLYLVQHYADVHFFLSAAVGVVTCVAVGWVASLLLPAATKPLEGLTIYG